MRQSKEAVSAAANAVTRLLDGGRLCVYAAGTPMPATVDAPVLARAIMLVEIRFGVPAFAPAVAGIADAMQILSGRAQASGAPGWCRALAADGRAIFDASAGPSRANPDLVIDAEMIVAGAEIVVASLRYQQPMTS